MRDCHWIFRVLDVGEYVGKPKKEKELYVGTGFLVSAKGYALTTWHNFDYDFNLQRFTDERRLENLRIAPRWGSSQDQKNWAHAKVVGKWSNRDEDFAVLKLDPRVVRRFRLRPAKLALAMPPPGIKVKGIGFHRPWELSEADEINGFLPAESVEVKMLNDKQHVIEVIFHDLMFEEGMSGGPIASDDLRFVLGIETACDLPARYDSPHPKFVRRLNKQEARGYATPISIVAESWPQIRDYCRIIEVSEDELEEIEKLKGEREESRQNLQALREQRLKAVKGEKRLQLFEQILDLEEGIRDGEARLNQLGGELESGHADSDTGLATFEEAIVDSYPLPIAQACSQFNQAQESGKQFAAFDRLVTYLVKYLAAIFIGQVRRDKPKNYSLPDKLAWVASPALENWTETIGDILQLYEKPPAQEKGPLADLLGVCKHPLSKSGELLDALDFMTLQMKKPAIDKPLVIDFLQVLTHYRENEWQEAAEQFPAEKITPVLHHLQPSLAALLNELHCLQHCQLVYLNRKDVSDSGVHLRLVSFMGLNTEDLHPLHKDALELTPEEAQRLKRNRFYVTDTDGVPQLDLHPFFILYLWELHVLERQAKTDFAEFRSCSRGHCVRPRSEARSFFVTWLQGKDQGPQKEELPPVLGEGENWAADIEPVLSDDWRETVPLTWLNSEGRQALEIALGEALRIGCFWLGIEFLLMGLSKQNECALSELMHEIGISRGHFRGILRGFVRVMAEDWRDKDVVELGNQALPSLQPADPKTLASNFQPDEKPPAVLTPRMLRILEDAHELAGNEQIGHDHLLLAALNHWRLPAIGILFGLAADAGWEPSKVQEWVTEHTGLTGGAAPAGDDELAFEPPGGGQFPGFPVGGLQHHRIATEKCVSCHRQ